MDLHEAVQLAEQIRGDVERALADFIQEGTVLTTAAGATGNAYPVDAHPVIAVHMGVNGIDFHRIVPEVALQLADIIPLGTSVTYIPQR
ncbi:hypothetical protein [Ensifer aridi]|uniref:hypothetical protein n=1 Tax=Ensifer aridi TaxID=1708715 RepID=UPI000A1098B0|nr:hypothetical protein [Ensifer aridi]